MAKILVVDDSDVDRVYNAGILRKAGHTILVAHDGLEGIDMAKLHKPDVILMDLVMPKMDGFTATRRLKRDPETKMIPLIIISSKSQRSDEVLSIRLGAAAYLVKPANAAELLKLVDGIR